MTLPKSREPISFSLFQKLLRLSKSRPWLEVRINALEELHTACQSERELELLVDLIERFKFLSGHDLRSYCDLVAEKITTHWKLGPHDTALVAKHFDDDRGDSSKVINTMMQPALARTGMDWKRRNFQLRAKTALRESTFRNLVLVDDFSGSGQSASDFLEWAKELIANEKLGEKNIYLVFFCAMEKTKEFLPEAEHIYVIEWLKRGISDHYPTQDIHWRLSDMIRLESSLGKLPRKFSLGFAKSESLYGVELLNIPNNNFPMFWWDKRADGSHRNALFNRIR